MIKELEGKNIAIVAMGKSQLDYHMSLSHSQEYDEVWAMIPKIQAHKQKL